jgi:hypothetical protein
MAKQIIVLGASTDPILTSISCVFWYPITSGTKAQANGSLWANASAAENTAIQNGTVLEESRGFQFPSGLTAANIKAFLVQYWTNRNAQINGVGPGLFANVFDDSVTGWSA